jgi:anti-sigma B factor antagonist
MSPAHTQHPEAGASTRLALIPQEPVVTTTADGDCFVVAIHGEIDLASAAALEDAAREALASAAPQIVVDLGACRFMDSTGLSALVRLNRRVTRDIHRDLLILPGPRIVQRAIEVSGLIDVLPFPED